MKKFISLAVTAVLLSGAASAQNNLNTNGGGLAGILGKVAGAINGSGSAGSDTTSNTINDILTTITGIINNNTLTEDKIPGNWTYSGSAVSFKSENALSNVASTFAEGTLKKSLTRILRRSESPKASSASFSIPIRQFPSFTATGHTTAPGTTMRTRHRFR